MRNVVCLNKTESSWKSREIVGKSRCHGNLEIQKPSLTLSS